MSERALVFCLDCLSAGESGARCRACRSPRLASHPELASLAIAHVDCDAFYAAIEKRDNPRLADRPVIIGGGRRGVVSTACYIARSFGVRSAMPMFKARELCPGAVALRPDMAKYARVAGQIRRLMSEFTPLVEPVSIDEAFLDLSGTQRLFGAPPALSLARLARRIETELGLTVSIGLSYCKFLAKLASDLDKPRGFSVIGRAEARAFLAERPAAHIWGVGRAFQGRLDAAGFRTIADLQRASEGELAARFGSEGRRLWRLAQGRDERKVSPVRKAKSISAETTFDVDVKERDALARALFALSERVGARLRLANLAAQSVTLKMKNARFEVRTRSVSLPEPTQLPVRLFEAARGLLTREPVGEKLRLIGLAAGALAPAEDADRGDLADDSAKRQRAAQSAIDEVRAKFGARAVVRGIVFDPKANED